MENLASHSPALDTPQPSILQPPVAPDPVLLSRGSAIRRLQRGADIWQANRNVEKGPERRRLSAAVHVLPVDLKRSEERHRSINHRPGLGSVLHCCISSRHSGPQIPRRYRVPYIMDLTPCQLQARWEAEQTPASYQCRREPQVVSTACEDPVQPTASKPPPLSSDGSFIASSLKGSHPSSCNLTPALPLLARRPLSRSVIWDCPSFANRRAATFHLAGGGEYLPLSACR